jgi:hypothetical protein
MGNGLCGRRLLDFLAARTPCPLKVNHLGVFHVNVRPCQQAEPTIPKLQNDRTTVTVFRAMIPVASGLQEDAISPNFNLNLNLTIMAGSRVFQRDPHVVCPPHL